MQLIVYTNVQSDASLKLVKALRSLKFEYEVFHDMAIFVKAVLVPHIGERVALFHASDRSELDLLFDQKDALKYHKLLLVLPDSRPETTRKGYRLLPRFVTDQENEFDELLSVINKIYRNIAFG